MNKQIEKKCQDCLHYEVCRFVNALAVANVVNAENCRMFKDIKDYRKIPTNDWLTKGISEEQLEREKQEALDEFAKRNGYCKAREIFEGVKQLIIQYRKGNISEYRLFIKLEELQQKYESEGADDV